MSMLVTMPTSASMTLTAIQTAAEADFQDDDIHPGIGQQLHDGQRGELRNRLANGIAALLLHRLKRSDQRGVGCRHVAFDAGALVEMQRNAALMLTKPTLR